MISIKSKHELGHMREAGKIAIEVLARLEEAAVVGATTQELDRLAESIMVHYSATPSFKGYRGFPGSLCASVNDVVIHGIPGGQVLQEGDILSVDIGVCVNGYHADCARTFPIGQVSEQAKKLIAVTEQSFMEGISYATPGQRLSNISHAVQVCVESNGFSVVRDFVGHGIGSKLHEDPSIPNFGAPGRGPRLYAGMTLAIEPMVNVGTAEVDVLDDGWTTVTADGSLSAHYENTVLITDNGPFLLTKE